MSHGDRTSANSRRVQESHAVEVPCSSSSSPFGVREMPAIATAASISLLAIISKPTRYFVWYTQGITEKAPCPFSHRLLCANTSTLSGRWARSCQMQIHGLANLLSGPSRDRRLATDRQDIGAFGLVSTLVADTKGTVAGLIAPDKTTPMVLGCGHEASSNTHPFPHSCLKIHVASQKGEMDGDVTLFQRHPRSSRRTRIV